MPYISAPRREVFAQFRRAVKSTRIDVPGELTYLLCWVCDQYRCQHAENYQTMNDVMGCLESAKAEFYRTQLGPYEEKKRETHGDIWQQEDK